VVEEEAIPTKDPFEFENSEVEFAEFEKCDAVELRLLLIALTSSKSSARRVKSLERLKISPWPNSRAGSDSSTWR
jgi:hypothetical protein